MKKKPHRQDDALAHLEELKTRDPKSWADYEVNLQAFKGAVLLRQFREEAGLSQEQLAGLLRITKQAVSKLENHGEDIKLSTLQKVAFATGHQISLNVKAA